MSASRDFPIIGLCIARSCFEITGRDAFDGEAFREPARCATPLSQVPTGEACPLIIQQFHTLN